MELMEEPVVQGTKADFKQTEVGLIPEDWEIFEFKSIVESDRPISYGIVQTGKEVINGVPCVRVVDLNEGKINDTRAC